MTSHSGGADNENRASPEVPPPGTGRATFASAVISLASTRPLGSRTVHVGGASDADLALPSEVARVCMS